MAWDDEEVQRIEDTLSPLEGKLFRALCQAGGQYVEHKRLIDAMWGDDINGGPLDARGHLSVYVTKLRIKLRKRRWTVENRHSFGFRLRRPAAASQPDISALKSIIGKVETAVAGKQEALSLAASDLARTVGPAAAAHELASLAIEMIDLAEREGSHENPS